MSDNDDDLKDPNEDGLADLDGAFDDPEELDEDEEVVDDPLKPHTKDPVEVDEEDEHDSLDALADEELDDDELGLDEDEY